MTDKTGQGLRTDVRACRGCGKALNAGRLCFQCKDANPYQRAWNRVCQRLLEM